MLLQALREGLLCRETDVEEGTGTEHQVLSVDLIDAVVVVTGRAFNVGQRAALPAHAHEFQGFCL